jgi:formate dehydrogenase gamma subunit
VEAKVKKSAHSAVACASCHLKHEEYPHPEKQPKPECGTCHESTAANYRDSEHFLQMQRGNQAAPECTTCHGTAHELAQANSPEFHRSVPETCGMCHDQVKEHFMASVHGKALEKGIRQAPVCSDCHGSHRILKPDNPRSSVFTAAVPDTCGRCHGDVRLASRFGLPADRITTFNSSFHGLALKSGRQSVADCASCHGYHDVFPSDDPRSKTNPKNLAKTCGACHPGAGSRFAIGRMHETEGQKGSEPAQMARLFYMFIIPGTLGFMLLHHAGDFIKKMSRMRFRGRDVPMQMVHPHTPAEQRMFVAERIQHALLAVSFIVLAFTGFALHYPDSWWAKPLVMFEEQYPLRGVIHRVAGGIMVGTSILHIVLLLTKRHLREHWLELLPRYTDVRETIEGTLWRLGLRDKKPETGSHTYIEKIEYWALVWGTAVMAATGALLWFNNWTLKMMPKAWMDFSRVVHFYEAVLATLAILIWHFYMVIFDPEVYPMDTAWLTGFSPRVHKDHTQSGSHKG